MNDLEALKRAYSVTITKKDQIDKKVEELGLLIAHRRDPQLLDELTQLEQQQAHLKEHVASQRQTLSKRGLTSSEIDSLKHTAPSNTPPPNFFPSISNVPFPSVPPPANENNLLETIENEKYHQKHIEEVNRWNQQEALRQQKIREQNLMLLQMQEQMQKLAMSQAQEIEKSKEQIEREKLLLQQREAQLNEQQKKNLREIDAKLAQLETERVRLAQFNQGLSNDQNAELAHLQNQRDAILSPGSQPPLQHAQLNSQVPGNQFAQLNSQVPGNQFAQLNSSQQGQFGSQLPQQPGIGQSGQFPGQPGQFPGGPGQQQGQFGSQLPPGQFPNQYSSQLQPGQFSVLPGQQPGQFSTLQPGSQFPGAQQPAQFASQLPGQFPGSQQSLGDQSRGQGGFQQGASGPYSGTSAAGRAPGEVDAWKEEQQILQKWEQDKSVAKETHEKSLQHIEEEHQQELLKKEAELRNKWQVEYESMKYQTSNDRTWIHQQLSDDILRQMSETELRLWMEHQQKGQYIDELLSRRQRLLDERAWILQQELQNKQMALSFREDDLRLKELDIQRQKELELIALSRIFFIFVETTNPEGKRTGKFLQIQVRASDSIFRICERIPHDNDLFCIKLEYNGKLLDDLDKNLLELKIPDNAQMISHLMPKADVDVLNLIPCEDCGKRFPAEVFSAHKCMKGYSQQLPSERRPQQRAAPKPAPAPKPVVTRTVIKTVAPPSSKEVRLIPCDNCNGKFPIEKISDHALSCRPRVVYYQRY